MVFRFVAAAGSRWSKMSNKIKFARSVNKNSIPAILDYGEPGYIKGQEMIIGNGDGTGFTVNDWNNLINKPDVEDTIVTIVAGETIPAYTPLAVNSSGRAIVADKSSTARARVYGFSLTPGNVGDTINIQVAGDITNSLWSFTPGMTYYLGQAGALVNTYLGFVSTDYVSPLGIAMSATTLAVNIELGFALGVLSVNGRSGSITLGLSDVGLTNPIITAKGGTGLQTIGPADSLLGVTDSGDRLEYKSLVAGDGIVIDNTAGVITISSTSSPASQQAHFSNSVAIIEETLAFLTVEGALGCRFDIVYHTADMANVRCESIIATIGAADAITWNAVTTQDIGDTSGIAAVISTADSDIELGFEVADGSWFFAITAYPITTGTVTYLVAGIPLPQPASTSQFHNVVAQTEEILGYLTVSGALACRFDIVYYTANKANVRLESILAVAGAGDAIAWNAVTTQDIGNTSGIKPVIGAVTTTSGDQKIELGFNITAGSWMFSVVAYPITISGGTIRYIALPL